MYGTEGRRKIGSDETLFDIIEFLESNGPAGVTEIAQYVDVTKGTVHAHLTTICERRYAVNINGKYQLGFEFLNCGRSVQLAHPLYPEAQLKTEQLVEITGERAWCQVEENGLVYYLCGSEGEHSVHPPVRIGRGVYAHTIAAGKAILAHLPEGQVRKIIERYGLPAKTQNTITDEHELFSELREIKRQGFAFNKQESLEGLHAVGAPIRDSDENVLGALSISGPANRLKGERIEKEIPELLLGATNELEINIIHA